MSLHLRRRGRLGTWYARGVIRVGRQAIAVPEFSTGSHSRADAEAAAASEEARIRADALDGGAARTKRTSISEAMLAYLRRPGGVPAYDADRIRAISDAIGERPVAEAVRAWSDAMAALGPRWSPATAARWRAVYVASLRAGCAALALPPPPAIPTVRERVQERAISLHERQRAVLLASYSPAAAAPVLLLAYAGLRTQEALRLDWQAVSFATRTLTIGGSPTFRTKSGRVRIVPMHPRVDSLLFGLWHSAGRPARGPVFLSARGVPYADTRGIGGNPLAKAHATACALASVSGFRLHDWRHDFATRFLAQGGDTRALMQVMGWTSARMVQRYVTFRPEHLANILARVA